MSETSVLDFSSMATPTLEPSAPETPETPVVETPEQQPETPETPTTETPTEPPKPGAKPEMKAIRDAVKAFEAANPELGKHLKVLLDNEGRIRAYQETYPDVETARSVKATLDAVGGVEGITELAKVKDFVDDVNAKWDAGDPSALDTIFEDGGEGAIKLLPHYMNRVEKANPQAFGESLRPHLVRNLQGANFEGVLSALSQAVADKPEAKTIVDSMVNWYSDQKRLSEKSNLDALAPEREKLTKQATELSQKEYKLFESDVNREVTPHIHKTFADNMRSYLANDTRPQAAKQDIARAWLSEMGKAMEKDNKQITQMMKSKSRNRDGIANFAKTRVSAVAVQVTNEIVKRYGLKAGQQPAKPGPPKPGEQPQLSTTAIKVNAKPSDEQIDWDKDPDRMLYITGKAYIKGSGKLVKWR